VPALPSWLTEPLWAQFAAPGGGEVAGRPAQGGHETFAAGRELCHPPDDVGGTVPRSLGHGAMPQ
jgi:hypothetical protein